MQFRKTLSQLTLALAVLPAAACGVDSAPDARPAPATRSKTSALACASYAVTDTGLPAGASLATPTAIDDNGNVAGWYYPSSFAVPHAFRWSAAGGFVDIPTLGGDEGLGHGVRGAQVVGESKTTSGEYHAFLSDSAGLHDLGTLGGSGIDASRAYAINSAGVIVGASRTASGEMHAAQLVDLIQKSPAWQDTAIIITYDENGGLWDHVAPPKVDKWGPGSRVPALIISPYAKKGYVDHTQYDTTSILKFIEVRWDLAPLTSRDANVNNLTIPFEFPATTPGMPTTGQGNALDLWVPVGAGVLLALAGLALRRRSSARG